MRDVVLQRISPGVAGTGESAVSQNIVTGKNNVLNNVSYISADRKGPPSWVVRCKETDQIFTVRDFTFERICMAA